MKKISTFYIIEFINRTYILSNSLFYMDPDGSFIEDFGKFYSNTGWKSDSDDSHGKAHKLYYESL